MKKVFIFDFDGVIADTLQTVVPIYNRICDKYGLQEIRGKEEFTELFNGNFYEGLAAIGISPQKSQGLLDEILQGLVKEAASIPPFYGIKEVLEQLGNKWPVLIITSNSSRVVQKFLDEKNISGVKEVLGVEVDKSKVVKINNIRNKYLGSIIYYIGDTTGDMLEGRRAQVKTIAVTWGFHSREKLKSAEPEFIVDSPRQLLSF